MRAALVAVSIVAVLAIGALAAVLVTGWSINDEDPVADETETEVITDAQVTWCWTYRDQLVVSADALDIRTSRAAFEKCCLQIGFDFCPAMAKYPHVVIVRILASPFTKPLISLL